MYCKNMELLNSAKRNHGPSEKIVVKPPEGNMNVKFYLQCTAIARITIFCRRRKKDNVMYNFGTVGRVVAYSCFSNVSCAIEAGIGPVSLLLCSHLP